MRHYFNGKSESEKDDKRWTNKKITFFFYFSFLCPLLMRHELPSSENIVATKKKMTFILAVWIMVCIQANGIYCLCHSLPFLTIPFSVQVSTTDDIFISFFFFFTQTFSFYLFLFLLLRVSVWMCALKRVFCVTKLFVSFSFFRCFSDGVRDVQNKFLL